MLTLKQIIKKLEDRNIMKVATSIGMHPQALYRIARGEVDPKYSTIEKLSKYLEEN